MHLFLTLVLIALSSCSLPQKSDRSINNIEATTNYPFRADVKKMEFFLESLEPIETLPEFNRVIRAQDLDKDWEKKCEKIIDPNVLNIFTKLIRIVFKKINIPIYHCQWGFATGTLLKDGIFMAGSQGINLKDPIELADFTFTLAHEISHYIHEISTIKQFSGREGYSLNNYPSYTLETYNECKQLKRQDRKWECELALWQNGHSEVDLYAAFILKKYGFQDWDTAEKGGIKNIGKIKKMSDEDKERVRLRYMQRFKIIKTYF